MIRRGFVFFQSKVDVDNVSLTDIMECLPGAEVKLDVSDQNLLLTIVVGKPEHSGSRVVALRFSSREERNNYLSKLR